MEQRVKESGKLLSRLFEEYDRGEQPQWDLLQDVPGVRLHPMTWDEASVAIHDGSTESLATLGRLPLEIKSYQEFRSTTILGMYASVTDYLLATIFSCECTLNKDGKRVAHRPDTFAEDKRVIWRENDFPYSLENSVSHHVLWASCPLSTAEIQEYVAENRKGFECLTFINPEVLKSVPTIWHAHVFSRKW